jgi:Zn-finger nucleic acid-binding protein
MKIAEREGVEIDYCTQCRGVWLDRGELEKIIAQVEQPLYRGPRDRDDHDDDDHEHYGRRSESRYRDSDHRREGDYRHGPRRREGFLSNLFDIFGD